MGKARGDGLFCERGWEGTEVGRRVGPARLTRRCRAREGSPNGPTKRRSHSLTTSTHADAPRGMNFLYSLNRLNVATSRDRTLSILACSPALFEPECRTPEWMRMGMRFVGIWRWNRACTGQEIRGP